MRKIILVFAAIVISASAYAQTDTINRRMSPRDLNHQNQNLQNNPIGDRTHPDGVVMQDGKMMKVKNGQMSILQDNDMTINGTKIMSDGSYVDRNGRKMKLKEGQRMDMSGNVTSMNTEKDRNMYLVPDSLRNKQF